MTILDVFKQGKPLGDEWIIDHHLHIGRVAKYYSRGTTLEEIIYKMDMLGINMGMISCISGSGYYQDCNREVIKAVNKFPERLIGQIILNPNYPEGYLEELNYCWDSVCFKGIKLHPVLNNYPIDGNFYKKIYSFAAQKGWPVLIHTWGMADIQIFGKLAEEFPETLFILAHSGGEIPAIMKAIKLAKRFGNIYLDSAVSWTYSGIIEIMVSGAGSEKILFGSDANWNSMEAALGRILFADLDDDQKRNIIGLNMKRILKM